MSRRAYPTTPRCIRCRMATEACICDAILPFLTSTRVVALVHKLEWQKSTNTSALMRLVLDNCEVRIRGDVSRPFDGSDLVADASRRAVLLYPADDAVPLEAIPRTRPLTLIVPDGNWRQARKVRHREPSLADIPCVRVTPTRPSIYRVRKNVRGPDALSTLEAVAEALRLLEGEAAAEALMRPFRLMVERTMAQRGRPPTSD